MNSDWTPCAELNDVLGSFVEDVKAILGRTLVGAYLQGSFALGEGDEQSDCDFLVVIREGPTPEQLGRIVLLHDAIPPRPEHWAQHLEGSYPLARDLRNLGGLGREWWYVDHGSRTVQRSTHCNSQIVRWILREKGIVLCGPDPTELVDEVPPEAMRTRMREDLETVVADVLSWATLDVAWVQRYVVATTCRILYTLDTAEVTSKRLALEWAINRFDPEWEPLISQVLADRPRGLVFEERPRAGSVERSLAFVEHARAVASHW